MDPRTARAQRGRKPPLSEVGEDPDPRFTFANERTFLAWNRTALALIAAGLAAAQLLDIKARGLVLALALPPIALGVVVAIASFWRWEQSERSMRLGEPLTYSPLPRILGYSVALVALLAIAVALVDFLDEG